MELCQRKVARTAEMNRFYKRNHEAFKDVPLQHDTREDRLECQHLHGEELSKQKEQDDAELLQTEGVTFRHRTGTVPNCGNNSNIERAKHCVWLACKMRSLVTMMKNAASPCLLGQGAPLKNAQ